MTSLVARSECLHAHHTLAQQTLQYAQPKPKMVDMTTNQPPAEVMHGELLGVWAKRRREAAGYRQEDVADRMADAGVEVDSNWVAQLETGRKKRAVQQPFFGALVSALGATEEEALRAIGLLASAPDTPRRVLSYAPDDPRGEVVDMLRGVSDDDLSAIKTVVDLALRSRR